MMMVVAVNVEVVVMMMVVTRVMMELQDEY